MTRLFLIALIVISFSAPSLAQSMMRVKVDGGTPITISVDGRYFDRRGTSITVGDLPPGIHLVKIYAETDYRWGHRYQDVIYKGRVRTDAGMITQLNYDHYNRSQRIQQFDMAKDTYNRGGNNSSDDAGNYSARKNYNDNEINDQSIQERSRQDYTPEKQPEPQVTIRDENRPAASPVTVDEGSMTDAKINRLKAKVNAKGTDTDKLKAIKEGLQNERITTYQVSVMMDWFSFESSKLEFAKWAYDSTTDKDNFSDLAAKFTYKDSEEDLRTFLKGK